MAKKKSSNKEVRIDLEASLDNLLHSVEIEGRFPFFPSWEMIQEFHTKLLEHEQWRNHLAFFDLYDIVQLKVQSAVSSLEAKEKQKLVDLITANQLVALKKEIVRFLRSIPRKYQLWIELPQMPRWGLGAVEISSRISIVESQLESPASEPGSGVLAALLARTQRSGESVYLRCEGLGYGALRANSSAVASAVSIAKQFFQLASGNRVVVTRFDALPLASVDGPRAILVDAELGEIGNVPLPVAFTNVASQWSVSEGALQVAKGGLIFGPQRKAETPEEKREALATELSAAREVLDCPAEIPDGQRIQTALEWGFDSANNENQTLALLQAFVGLEALLGDDEKDEPLVARLADRCAYLLGRGAKDRDGIRKKFRALYDVRSKLVHGRKARLDVHDLQQLYSSQILLRDVTNQEVWHVRQMRRPS